MGKIKVRRNRELNEYISNQPAFKKAMEQLGKKHPIHPLPKIIKATHGMPKDLATAIAVDKRIEGLVEVARRVAECTSDTRKILKKRFKSGKRQQKDERAFTKKWANIEKDYQTMVRVSYELVSEIPLIDEIATAVIDIGNIHAFANPVFLPREYMAVAKYMGVEPRQLTDMYAHLYLPNRDAIDKSLASGNIRNGFKKSAKKSVDKLVFPYAPQHLIQENVFTMGGDLFLEIVAVIGAIASILAYMEELKQTALANRLNIIVLAILWVLWMDAERRRLMLEVTLNQLYEQLRLETEGGQVEPPWISETKEGTLEEIVKVYGNAIGNMSRSKLELHLPNCPYLHLINPQNIQMFDTLEEGRALGLDNCHYCIGGSTR